MRSLELKDLERGPVKAYYIGPKNNLETNSWYWIDRSGRNIFAETYKGNRVKYVPVSIKYLRIAEKTPDGVIRC